MEDVRPDRTVLVWIEFARWAYFRELDGSPPETLKPGDLVFEATGGVGDADAIGWLVETGPAVYATECECGQKFDGSEGSVGEVPVRVYEGSGYQLACGTCGRKHEARDVWDIVPVTAGKAGKSQRWENAEFLKAPSAVVAAGRRLGLVDG